MNNENDKFRHAACIQKENRNAVDYDCRDVAIILRQLKFKQSQSTNTFHNERKKFSNQCAFSKSKGQTKSTNHEVLGLWQRSFRLHDVINFDVIGRLYPKDQEKSKSFYCQQILLNQLHKRQKYREIRERHPPVIAV